MRLRQVRSLTRDHLPGPFCGRLPVEGDELGTGGRMDVDTM